MRGAARAYEEPFSDGLAILADRHGTSRARRFDPRDCHPVRRSVGLRAQRDSPVLGRIPFSTQVFKTSIQEGLLRERLLSTLSGLFGSLAALLATIGLYGVMSYTVERRRGEIGIRIALGAGRIEVLRLILREACLLLAVGLPAGIVLAFAGASAASSMLFGLRPHDPLTMLTAIGALAGVSLLATYIPARRAASLDPMIALRHE